MEARNAATSAARRDGVTLGEWLDRAIRQQVKAERAQPVGPTIEETLAKLAEGMARQAEATQHQVEQARQENAAMLARLEAMEQRRPEPGRSDRGNLLGRLYGLLWRIQAQPESTGR